MAQGQTCNAAGRAIIESEEKFSPLPYPDPNGIPTQGFGHTRGVTLSSPEIDLAQGDEWLEEDLSDAEGCLNTFVITSLSSNQFSALCSLVFNIGSHAFETSALCAVINAGNLDQAPNHIILFVKDRNGDMLNGLVTRRQKEIALWNTPDPDSDNVDNAA